MLVQSAIIISVSNLSIGRHLPLPSYKSCYAPTTLGTDRMEFEASSSSSVPIPKEYSFVFGLQGTSFAMTIVCSIYNKKITYKCVSHASGFVTLNVVYNLICFPHPCRCAISKI